MLFCCRTYCFDAAKSYNSLIRLRRPLHICIFKLMHVIRHARVELFTTATASTDHDHPKQLGICINAVLVTLPDDRTDSWSSWCI